jgi:predicted nucleic acid-binding protein
LSAETPRALLDTNIVIHQGRLPAEAIPAVHAISTITIAELSAGVTRASDDDERARRLDLLQRVESTYEPISFDLAAARAFGRVNAAGGASGRSPRSRIADQMIASIALANGLTLYTTNDADYVGLDGILEVVAVARPSD